MGEVFDIEEERDKKGLTIPTWPWLVQKADGSTVYLYPNGDELDVSEGAESGE